jgi:regulation of enolase protein 1 (concanavalin A-like superfamily)
MIGEFRWRNEPPFHEWRGDTLVVRTQAKSDFWNNTFYGFKVGNGHHFARSFTGDFSAIVEFSADYQALYDQAGVMIWVDDRTWLKAGVEYTDGALHISVVATRDDQSDWSVMPTDKSPAEPLTFRITRHAETVRVQVRTAEGWQAVHLAYLPMPECVEVGPMCCSPTGAGLEVRFSRFEMGPPISRELHAPEESPGGHD